MASVQKESLFPSRMYAVLFVGYILLFVNQGILVTASKDGKGNYTYNTTTVVLLTETFKLFIAISLFVREKSCSEFLKELKSNFKIFLLYLIPAFLYCLYNNLAFTNLKHYDPTSYFLLLNFRTVTTGVLFQLLFSKQLSRRQWAALIILTVGCVVKQVRLDSLSSLRIEMDFHLVLMLVQILCSCFAGVFNEFLLKDSGTVAVHIMIQNVFMYIDSVIMNVGFLAFNGELLSSFTPDALSSVIKVSVLAIVVNNGVAGIVTSIFLKAFNSILKAFAGAIELMLTAVLSWLFFTVPINSTMLLAIALVSLAMYLYTVDPVINKPSTPKANLHLSSDESDETEKEKAMKSVKVEIMN